MNLITDRTAADVALWQSLRNKAWRLMTDGEREQWLSSLKGCYNYTDLNRVESAVKYVSELLQKAGYRFYPETKTDWTMNDSPTQDDMSRYLGNIADLRNVIAVRFTTPEAPTVEEKLDYQGANDIETIVGDVTALTENMYESWSYSADGFSGDIVTYWHPARTINEEFDVIEGALVPFGSTQALITADGAVFVCKEA